MSRVAALWDEWADEDLLGEAMSPFYGGVEAPAAAVFPYAPLPVVVEISPDGASWWDSTDNARISDGITIRRGQANEASAPEPGSMTLTLDNRDGKFSPRNPTSPLYGFIGRNTPLRVRVDMPQIAEADRVRGIGEVSEWPPRWDVSGRDSTVGITAQGILRRLGQGSKPLQSPLRSFLTNLPNAGIPPFFVPIPVYAYWPCEDGAIAASIAPGFVGDPPMRYSGTAPDFAGLAGFLGSDKIIVLGATTALSGTVTRSPATLDSFEVWDVEFIIDVPTTTGWADGTVLLRVSQQPVGTTVAAWEVRYKSGAGGDVQLATLDAKGGVLATSGTINLNIDGGQFAVTLRTNPSGSDVILGIGIEAIDANGDFSGAGSGSFTFAGTAATRITQIQIAPNGGATDLGIGHIWVNYGGALAAGIPMTAYVGETADQRALRLCGENDVPFTLIGASFASEEMGPQAIPSNFVENLTETYRADSGVLYETRAELGLTLRTRRTLYNQTAALQLDYRGAGEIAPDLQPTDDDQNVRNKITVTRKSGDVTGSSAIREDTTSRMGTAAPPLGVGTYDDSMDVNVETDDQLPGIASWWLHVGTWDEARYPVVVVDMAALAKAGKFDLLAAVAALDVGDRLRLVNLPVWVGANDSTVDLLCLGFTERFDHPNGWRIELNCVPNGPWLVLTEADVSNPSATDGREAHPGSTLTSAIDTAATSVAVTNNPPVSWGSVNTPYDVRVGGERMTVTAVSGSGSSQTLTVTRSVNSIVKSHIAGEQVQIVQPLVEAL